MAFGLKEIDPRFEEAWNLATCLDEVAEKIGKSKAACHTIATRMRKAGFNLKDLHQKTPLEVRFWKYVSKTDGCWEWIGYLNPNGYGELQQGRTIGIILAHRLSYRIHFGEFDESLLVCHHCDNPPCVRPDHLFLGTMKDNMQDMANNGRGNSEKVFVCDRIAEEVIRLRSLGMSYSKIAKETGVSMTTAWNIVTGSGKIWSKRLLQREESI